MFDYVSAKECLGEAEAAAFIQQILFAIKHLHDNHVVHLDIKANLFGLLLHSFRCFSYRNILFFRNCRNLKLRFIIGYVFTYSFFLDILFDPGQVTFLKYRGSTFLVQVTSFQQNVFIYLTNYIIARERNAQEKRRVED